MAGLEGLEQLRRMIDDIDDKILELLDKRMEMCRRIGELKAKQGRQVVDHRRTAEVLEKAGRYRGIYVHIIDACIKEQEKLLTKNNREK